MPNTAPGNPNDPNEQNRRSEMIATILWYSLADKGTRTTGQAPAKTTAKTPTKTPTKGLVIRTKEIIQDVDSIGRQYCVDTNQGGLRVPCPGVVEVPEKKERVRNNRVYEMIAALGELHTGNPSDRKVDSVFNRLDKLNVAELQKVVDFYAGRPGATPPPKDVKDQLTEAVTKKRTKPYTAKIPDPTPDEPPIPLLDPGKPPPPEAEGTPQPPPPPEPEAETPSEAPKPPKEKKPRTRKPKATKAPTTKADRTGSPRNKTEAIHDIVDIVTRGEQSTSPAPVTSSETSSTESDTEKTPNTSQEGVSISEPFEDEGDFTGKGGESEVAQPEATKPEATKQPTPPPDNSNLPLPDEFQDLGKEDDRQPTTDSPKPSTNAQRVRESLLAKASEMDITEERKRLGDLATRELLITGDIAAKKLPLDAKADELLAIHKERRKILRGMNKKASKARNLFTSSMQGNAKIKWNRPPAGEVSPEYDNILTEGTHFVQSILSGVDASQGINISAEDKLGQMRSGYSVSDGIVHIVPGKVSNHVVAHEMGHWIERNVPGVWQSAQEFYNQRFAGEDPVSLPEKYPNMGYSSNDTGKKDGFEKIVDERSAYYMGRQKWDGGTEIISMGLEALFRNPVGLAKNDPEYFDFLVGILDGSRRDPKGGTGPKKHKPGNKQ